MPLHLEARMVRDALAEHVVALCGRCRAAVTPPPSPFLPYPPRLLLPYPLRPAESRPLPPHAMSARLPHRRVHRIGDRDTTGQAPFRCSGEMTQVWEIVYSKDRSVKEVNKVLQLKGHKSDVTCLCFAPISEQIIISSRDGSIRVWNINGDIDGIAWPPWTIPNAGVDKKVKLLVSSEAINRGFSMCHNAPLDR
ncbi:hypothetical protein U9M48_013852 [Paspalum notatum var. saurae]|uniref:Uncharacterized protein n=1 Tax=Paspalum notatum var. saurae TaxID=547442 RepID=A0AAQ3T018_PASNO